MVFVYFLETDLRWIIKNITNEVFHSIKVLSISYFKKEKLLWPKNLKKLKEQKCKTREIINLDCSGMERKASIGHINIFGRIKNYLQKEKEF